MQSVPSSLWEWLAALSAGERFDIMVLGALSLTFIVAVVFLTIYKMHKNRLDDALKRELLDRGMSAEEIVSVVRARPTRRVLFAPPPSYSGRDVL